MSDGYLYAIADPAGRVKFGRSAKHPASRRLSDLQIGNAAQLTLLATCHDEPIEDIERHVHSCLTDLGLHERGEWFRPSIYTTITVASMAADDLPHACQFLMDAVNAPPPWPGHAAA